MRTLFEMDTKNYNPDGKAFVRPSVRGIILQNGKIAMVHSILYDYYKLPGGGMEPGESRIDTLIREVREESGLQVLRHTVREYGVVSRRQKSSRVGDYEIFIQENYHYLCCVAPTVQAQHLDDYERREQFTLEWMNPYEAMAANRACIRGQKHGPKSPVMLEREARVLECLLKEGYFDGISESPFPKNRNDTV